MMTVVSSAKRIENKMLDALEKSFIYEKYFISDTRNFPNHVHN